MPNFNIRTIWIHVFECYVVRCVSKNVHQKDTSGDSLRSIDSLVLSHQCGRMAFYNLGGRVTIKSTSLPGHNCECLSCTLTALA